MMKPFLLPLAFLISAHAGEFSPATVAPSAKWWLHADLDAARESQMGQRIVAEIDERRGAQLKALKRMFSVNPVTDFGGITLYGDGRDEHAVVLIQGSFDRAHLEDLIVAADDYSSSDHAGVKIHSWTDDEKTQHAAFVRDDLLVFSEHDDLLTGALGVLKSGEGMEADPFVSAGSAKPMLVGAAQLSQIEMKGDDSKLMKKAESLRIALAESGERMEGRMMLGVGKPAHGTRFRRVMEGMIALGELGDSSLEQADMKFESSIEQGGRVVRAKLSLPTEQMISMMDQCGAFDMIGE